MNLEDPFIDLAHIEKELGTKGGDANREKVFQRHRVHR